MPSSDQDENHTVLQHTDAPEWTAPVAQVPPMASVPSDEDDPFADDRLSDVQLADDPYLDEEINTDDLVTPTTEDHLPQWATPPPLMSKETLGTFWRQFAPVLVPLPFGLLVFLVTLPATLQGLAAQHPSVLIMAILLVALMIAQGTLIYFAGSNDTLLTLDIVGGYAVFIIVGVFAAFGLVPAIITLVVLLIIGVLLARRGIHQTSEGYVDIVTSFGKYAQTLEPGLNLLLPWERVEYSLNTQEISWTTPKMEVPTARDQKVELTAMISYQLMPEDAYLAATSVKNWESSLRDLFRGTVQSVVNELTMTDFIAWTQSLHPLSANADADSFNPAAVTRWDRINNALIRRMQDQVAHWGVQIHRVYIQDLTPLPTTAGGLILHSNGDTGGTTQIIKDAAVAPQSPALPEALPAPVTPAPAVPASPPKKTVSTPKSSKIEALVDMYDAVRQNTITEPKVIADLAQRFEALANDPVASKDIEFDASRAAETLRQRAQKLQDIVNS